MKIIYSPFKQKQFQTYKTYSAECLFILFCPMIIVLQWWEARRTYGEHSVLLNEGNNELQLIKATIEMKQRV